MKNNRLWLISDLHFNHKNIIKYCNRPFSSVEDMNQTLIDNWNSVIADDDEICVVGDFVFGNFPQLQEITKSLKGRKIIVLGNHDKFSVTQYLRAGFIGVYRRLEIEYSGLRILLSHYPYKAMINPEFPRKYHNYYPSKKKENILIHGHCHSDFSSKLRKIDDMIMYDVGVDGNNFYPTSLEAIINVSTQK